MKLRRTSRGTFRVEYVLPMDRIWASLEKKGLAPSTVELILALKTPSGIINGYQLAAKCERVTGMGIRGRRFDFRPKSGSRSACRVA
jgi:hypothetical protein